MKANKVPNAHAIRDAAVASSPGVRPAPILNTNEQAVRRLMRERAVADLSTKLTASLVTFHNFARDCAYIEHDVAVFDGDVRATVRMAMETARDHRDWIYKALAALGADDSGVPFE